MNEPPARDGSGSDGLGAGSGSDGLGSGPGSDGLGSDGLGSGGPDSAGSTDDWFPLAELAGRLGGLVWVERTLADVLDGWSLIEPHDRTCNSFATAAAHHRWHAEVVADCLPTSPALAEAAAVAPPSPRWAIVADLLASVTEPERTVARLTALVREVDPWLARETGALLELGRPVADAAITRWLRFIDIDHHEDGATTAALLDALATNTVDLRERSFLTSIELREERR